MHKVNETYQAIFNLRANTYHQAMTQWPHARQKEFEIALSFCDLSDNHCIVDIPSGGGYLSKYISKLEFRAN